MWYQPYDEATGARFGAPSSAQGTLPAGYRYFAQEAEPIAELYEWVDAEFRFRLRHNVPRLVSKADFLTRLGDDLLEDIEHASVERATDGNPLQRKRARIRAWLRRLDALPSVDLASAATVTMVQKLVTLDLIDVTQRDAILAPDPTP